MFDRRSPAGFTVEQRRAATPGRSTAVLASAGSGKTAVLVERYLATLRSGLDAADVLVVTFTRAAAAEVRHRALEALERNARESTDGARLFGGATRDGRDKTIEAVRRSPYLGTLHGVALELLRRWGGAAGLAPVERVATESEVAERLRASADEAVTTLEERDAIALADAFSPSDWRALTKLALELRMTLEPLLAPSLDRHDARGTTARAIRGFYAAWDRALARTGVYAYGDLERVAVTLAESDSPAGEALRGQFRAALVDEFQDTNVAQWRLVRALLRWDSASPGELFVVGDPRQSIYRFRGARPELFASVADEIVAKGGDLVTLSTNFRSRPALVDATNRLLAPLFGAGTLEATPTTAGREHEDAIAVRALRYDSGEKRAEQRRAEAEAVAHHVATALAAVDPSRIAVLLRSSEPMALFADALRQRGLPVAAQRTVDVFATEEAQALLALFRAVRDPLDDFAVASLLRSAWGAVDSAELESWRKTSRDRALFETMLERGGGPACVRALAEIVERGLTDPSECYRQMTRLAGRSLPPTEAALRVLETAAQAGDVREAVLALDRWSAEGAFVHERPQGPGVRILTVHGSKGLEFDHVFLADLYRTAPRLQPPLLADETIAAFGLRHRDCAGNAVEEAEYETLKEREILAGQWESKRLLYVAVTRARERLWLVQPNGLTRTPKDAWAAWVAPLLDGASPAT
jgi:ATP-dependent exoDNAse (exonuclease V) beta subunit